MTTFLNASMMPSEMPQMSNAPTMKPPIPQEPPVSLPTSGESQPEMGKEFQLPEYQSTSTRPDVAATPSIQTNGKRCSASDEQEEDSKRSECFKAADEMFQKLLSDPAANYGRALCEQISNKVNYCIPSFNAKCSTPDQIKDYQFGNLFNFLQTELSGLRHCLRERK